jgi:hypothetical protein
MRVAGVSDVSIGYGSPEVPALMHSLCRMLGVRGELIEPDEIARPPITLDWDAQFDLVRIPSRFIDHSRAWHGHYLSSAARRLNRTRPDVVVVFGGSVFPITLLFRWKPPTIIYHAYEFISNLSHHGRMAHTMMLPKVDLMIAPDCERLIIDLQALRAEPRKTAAIYNVADVDFPNPVLTSPAAARNGHFLFFGTLHRRHCFAQYFWDPALAEFRFDICGRITDPEPHVVRDHLVGAKNVSYHGVLPAAQLNRLRANFSYSLVWWNPEINPGFFYVPSNRLFTSIQAHVPLVTAPHPQCVTLIKRYGCGLVSADWSINSLASAFREARDLMGTAKYDAMVAGCRDAVETEINWDAQFDRLAPKLQKAIAVGQRPSLH